MIQVISLGVMCLILLGCVVKLHGDLMKSERALRHMKTHFNRAVIAKWAETMPKTGSVAVDHYCAVDVIYFINPETLRHDPIPEEVN